LLKTPKALVNAFGTFNWVIEEGWSQIPRKLLEENVIKEANNSNAANEDFGR
jgi:hypothetical protein